ncbi:MAG TPA: hypothetical protein VIO15_09085 [Bacteroidales bacterium]
MNKHKALMVYSYPSIVLALDETAMIVAKQKYQNKMWVFHLHTSNGQY